MEAIQEQETEEAAGFLTNVLEDNPLVLTQAEEPLYPPSLCVSQS